MTREEFIKAIKTIVSNNQLAQVAYSLAMAEDNDGLVALYKSALSQAQLDPDFQHAHCRKGCDMCCSLAVDINRFEIPSIRRAFNRLSNKKQQQVLSKMLSKHEHTKSLSHKDRYKTRRQCGFNQSGECIIYEDRPLACRAFVSFDLSKCAEGHPEGTDSIIPMHKGTSYVKEMIDLGVGLYEMEHNNIEVEDLGVRLEDVIVEDFLKVIEKTK